MHNPVSLDLRLDDVLDEHRRSRPHELAVVDGDVRFDYAEMAGRNARLVNLLRNRGVGAGDRVAWVGQNSFRVLELMLAAGRLGAMVCPVNWRQSTAELSFVLADLEPALSIVDPSGLGDVVDGVRTAASVHSWLMVDDSAQGYERLVAAAEPTNEHVTEADDSQPVLVMYTAAHEGQPNGALMTHRGLIAAAVLHATMNGAFERRPVFLAASPLYHIATLMGCLSTFVLGGTNVYLPRVDAKEMRRLIDSEACTWAYITGPTIGQLADAAEAADSALMSLSTPKAYVAADGRWAHLGVPSSAPWSLHPGSFGQTEMTGMITYTALGVGAAGAAGRTSPWCLTRLVDADGNEVAPGETGEITARGVTAGAGYWNRPELNAARSRGGWWHTNDLGRREADGSLSFVGPKTRMIKSGKENIYPAEVERCLREHPSIADAAVIGVPDEVWEQSVTAIVVARDGAALSADDVIAHCRSRIASYKKPKAVRFVEALPRPNGQLDRNALDQMYGGGGYPGVG
jgi:acyl-CoA synthetase (AMP-forming)/AMP-acid ligase II